MSEQPKSYLKHWQTFEEGRGKDELRPICIAFAEHLRPHTLRALFDARNELAAAREEADWIRAKLGLPTDATSSDVYGRMHVLESNSHGYVTYIKAHKCDDKQGEIARLTVQLATAKAQLEKIVEIGGCDQGCILVSAESPTKYDPEAKCQVYLYENFSPLGDALVELHRTLSAAADVREGE